MAFENAVGIRGLAIFFLIDFVVPFRRSDSRFSLNTTLAQLLVASIFFFSSMYDFFCSSTCSYPAFIVSSRCVHSWFRTERLSSKWPSTSYLLSRVWWTFIYIYAYKVWYNQAGNNSTWENKSRRKNEIFSFPRELIRNIYSHILLHYWIER